LFDHGFTIIYAGRFLGGLVAVYYKIKGGKEKENISVSVIILLPFLCSPLEQAIATIPGTYQAYTYIDIQASKVAIWNNVTSVKAINRHQDKGWLTRSLGFPRPIKAELNYEGIGTGKLITNPR